MKSLYGLLLLLQISALNAAELEQATLRAWEDYVRVADNRAKTRSLNSNRFLLVDEFPETARLVRRGEIWVTPFGKNGTEPVPNGLSHDWIGVAFIPSASVEDVLSVVRSYSRYSEFYRPAVLESRCISSDPSQDHFSMLWLKKVFFTAVTLDGDYESHYSQSGEKRWNSTSSSTRIQEIEGRGKPSERRLAPDEGSGYIWRLSSFARYEARDSGVYVEVEAIALSREIPISVRWLVAPMVARASRDALTRSLEQTHHAVAARGQAFAPSALVGDRSTFQATEGYTHDRS